MAANVFFKKLTQAQFDTITTKDKGTLYRVVQTDNSEDFYIGALKLNNGADFATAIANLDASEFALATESSGVVTIKGIKETDGVIAVGTDTTKNITLAKAATTGAAEDISIADAGSLITAETVEGALQELASASAGGVASKTIWGHDESSGQSDYAKVYKIYQGENDYVADRTDGKTNPTLKLTINIPKDKVLEDSSIVDITFSNNKLYDGVTDVTTLIKGSDTPTAADAGKYLKMEMQNVTDPLYVNLQTFVDVYTVAANASEVQLALNDHEFSATIVKVNASKVEYKAETSAGAGDGETVLQALTRLDGSDSTTGSVAKKAKDAATAAVAALDADVDASGTAAHGGTFVVSGITEVDGVITAVDSVEVEAAGAAATAIAALDADLDASGTAAHGGTFVMSGVTEVDGVLTAVDSVEVEAAGAAATAKSEVIGTSSDVSTDSTIFGAKAYSDSLASNYDPAGSASTAQSNAESYCDSAISSALTWEVVSAE